MPDVLELPRSEPVGFAMNHDEEDMFVQDLDYAYALYGDDLALLGSPTQRE